MFLIDLRTVLSGEAFVQPALSTFQPVWEEIGQGRDLRVANIDEHARVMSAASPRADQAEFESRIGRSTHYGLRFDENQPGCADRCRFHKVPAKKCSFMFLGHCLSPFNQNGLFTTNCCPLKSSKP